MEKSTLSVLMDYRHLLGIFALTLDRTAIYLSIYLWKANFGAGLALAFIFSLFFGYYSGNMKTGLIYTILSSFTTLLATLILLLIPPLAFGHYWYIQLYIEETLSFTLKFLLIELPCIIIGIMFGWIASGK